MRIAAMHKCSFVDYPAHLAAVVFTPGCNLRCHYCHNPSLLADPAAGQMLIEPAAVLDFLALRRGLLDGLVITGGEPTLQKGLGEFCAAVHELGLLVKLDTNGTRPAVLAELIARRRVDFVAMDVKAPLGLYDEVCGCTVDTEAIGESIRLLLAGQVEYEFRTTFAPPLTAGDMVALAAQVRGARRYVIQQYRPPAGVSQRARRPAWQRPLSADASFAV
jgi:pyruvate formate lyase activating enzyme